MSYDNEDEEPKTAAEVLVEALRNISIGFQQLTKAGLPRSMVKAWLFQKTKVGMQSIDKILDALGELQEEMLKPVD